MPDSSLFQQFLANSLTSPASRSNYTSGAKIWIEERGGDGSALRASEPNAVAKGASNLRPHSTNPAPPLTPGDLVAVCRYLSLAEDGPTLIAALTIGFFGFLRASNLLCPTTTLWAGPHTLSRQNIMTTTDGLIVLITSSKTLGPGSAPVALRLPRIPGSPACPTQAWDTYIAKVHASPLSPAFLLRNGSPLTPGSTHSCGETLPRIPRLPLCGQFLQPLPQEGRRPRGRESWSTQRGCGCPWHMEVSGRYESIRANSLISSSGILPCLSLRTKLLSELTLLVFFIVFNLSPFTHVPLVLPILLIYTYCMVIHYMFFLSPNKRDKDLSIILQLLVPSHWWEWTSCYCR